MSKSEVQQDPQQPRPDVDLQDHELDLQGPTRELEPSSNREEDKTTEYGETRDMAEQVGNKAEAAQKAAQEEINEISVLRDSLDLPPTGESSTRSMEYATKLTEEGEELSEAIAEKEQALLAYPDGEGSNPSDVMARIEDRIQKATEAVETLSKEARAEMINEYIIASTADILEQMQSFIDECANAGQARELITQKTARDILEHTKDYVDNGDDTAFGFNAECSGKEFDGPSGEKIKYLTEYTITFDTV